MEKRKIYFEKKEHFDVVTCLEAIEHVPDPNQLVKTCADLCKKNGDIFFSTINKILNHFFLQLSALNIFLNLLPKGTHEYEKFIKPSELIQMMENNGLTIKELTGMSYNP